MFVNIKNIYNIFLLTTLKNNLKNKRKNEQLVMFVDRKKDIYIFFTYQYPTSKT